MTNECKMVDDCYAENKAAHAVLDEKLDKIAATLIRIENSLYGNGREGLVLKVDRNTRTLGSINKFLWIVITGIITIGITAGIMAFI